VDANRFSAVVYSLGAIACVCIICVAVLVATGRTDQNNLVILTGIVNVVSVAVGALAGFLVRPPGPAPQSGHRSEDKQQTG
jgi:hypothetical protein